MRLTRTCAKKLQQALIRRMQKLTPTTKSLLSLWVSICLPAQTFDGPLQSRVILIFLSPVFPEWGRQPVY